MSEQRIITNEDISKYDAMVEKWIRDSVCKNWREASMSKTYDEVSLGNTGMSMSDVRQFLRMQVFIALTKYNPEYRTKEGRSVKESTFVHLVLSSRIGQIMKKLTLKKIGYGVWSQNLEQTFNELNMEE